MENASELRPEDNTLKLLLAQASIKAGEPLEALAVLKGVPAEAGVPGELAFLRGSAYLLSGEPEEAHPLLSSAIDADPKNADYLFALAGLQGSEQSYEAALRTLEKARQLDHRSEAIPYQIAVTFALMGRYADATKACEEALSLSTQRAEVYFLRGVIKLEQRDGLEAERALREAISLSADVALYHAALGVALLLVENLEESKKELDRARILNPKTAPAYLWRARVLGRLKHPEMAIADLETYLALQPQSAYALHELEVLCAAAGQAEKASAARAKYQALNADHDASERAPSFLDELWMTRIREGLGLLG